MKTQGEKILNGCLVGKVLLSREVKVERLRAAMQQVWRTGREVKVESLGDNIFMFRFGSNDDKRRILAGGPWHFDRALIVLVEPVGIGDIKKQSFSHVSFWVQLHDVPIVCMEKGTAAELGGAIGKVEEVEMDVAGECIGKFLRMRISVDITKPLKKIVVLEQEEEDEEEGREGTKKEDIPMLVNYERLPDFCFCCGRIGHQYRECAHYKSQSKDKLAYGPWLKANTTAERLRHSRGKDRWGTESSQPNVESIDKANKDLLQITERKQQEAGVQAEKEGMNNSQMDSGINSFSPQKTKGRDAEENPKQAGSTPRKLEDSYLGIEKHTDNTQTHGEETEEAGKNVKGRKNGEIEFQMKELRQKMNMEKKEAAKDERERNERLWKREIIETQHKVNGPIVQTEPEIEDGDNGTSADKYKPKRRKWKFQARNCEGKGGSKDGPIRMKRPASCLRLESPKSKKLKECSPKNRDVQLRAQPHFTEPAKLRLEDEESDEMEDVQHSDKEISAVAEIQPRRQP